MAHSPGIIVGSRVEGCHGPLAANTNPSIKRRRRVKLLELFFVLLALTSGMFSSILMVKVKKCILNRWLMFLSQAEYHWMSRRMLI